MNKYYIVYSDNLTNSNNFCVFSRCTEKKVNHTLQQFEYKKYTQGNIDHLVDRRSRVIQVEIEKQYNTKCVTIRINDKDN